MLPIYINLEYGVSGPEEAFLKNKMARNFPFRNMKIFSYLKNEKFHLQICLEFYKRFDKKIDF